MERVLVNLLKNAAKYGAAPIEITAGVTPDSLVLSVRDHGPGLPAALKGHEAELVGKLTRGESESAALGVGLGLAICKPVLDAHRARIVAVNAQGGRAEGRSLPSPCRAAIHPSQRWKAERVRLSP